MTKNINLNELAASMEIAAQQLRDVDCTGITKEHYTEYRASMQASLAKVTNERDSWAQRFKALDADMRGTMLVLNETRAALDATKADRDDFKYGYKAANGVREAMSAELSAARRDIATHSEHAKELTDKIRFLEAECAARGNAIATLQAQVDIKAKSVQRLGTLNDELSAENSALRAKIAAFETVITHLSKPNVL